MDIYEFTIPDETEAHATENACGFFGLPESPVADSDGECAHSALQDHAFQDFESEEGKCWELSCDFLAGIHAEMHGMDTSRFEEALGQTEWRGTHPDGGLRVEAISGSGTSGHGGADISFGSAYSREEYVSKAENCYKEAERYTDKALRDENASDKAHNLAEAEKWRRRGDEYMQQSKYAD